MKLKTRFFDLDHDIREAKNRLKCLLFWNRHRAPLEKVNDVFVPDVLYDYHTDRIPLQYTGKAKKHDEAREDFRRLRKEFRMRSTTYRLQGGFGTDAPQWFLDGDGWIGKIKIRIEVAVPWFKPGCEVRSEPHREVRTFRTYSVSCNRNYT